VLFRFTKSSNYESFITAITAIPNIII
jgi:hypothetical protein